MKRSSAIRRAVLATAAVALVATGCTAQAAGSGGGKPSAPTTGASARPSASSSATPPAPSASGTATPDGKPSSPAPAAKALMKDGDENEQVRELQARLRQLDHFDRAPTGFYGSITAKAVSGFQKKRGLPETGSVDGATWQRLLGMTKKPTADELKPSTTNKLDTPDARCMTGRVLCISKESRTLAWMIDGRVVSSMDVRFGSENTPTREGIFSVGWKAKEWTSTIYHTPMPYAMFFSGGQAVHYSADFAARGYNGASHGCVNVRDRAKLSALFDQVKVGDKVVVHW
ncbi:L,D-transpeptidase family protein [Streptomyces hydrogenans]|uniref:L,D-transpeptidase family protein n=1 Tax=Streptomyces TaxID=1883 RepID=UPI00202F8C51|nr:L,D-transpeptidase family protein [Streptomyces sp. G2]MCM1944068.1 L,D-transpeptidase family protein [Streptomyces sp. G2]